MEHQEPTLEDFQRTQNRILSSFENGHGIELSPAEVERVVTMMQGMELSLRNAAFGQQQAQHLLACVLDHIRGAAGDEALAFPGSMMQSGVTGFKAEWVETEDTIIFELFYDDEEEVVEGEVVEAEAA